MDEGKLELAAWVGRPDGSAWLADRLIGDPAEIGGLVAERMLAGAGARSYSRMTVYLVGAGPGDPG